MDGAKALLDGKIKTCAGGSEKAGTETSMKLDVVIDSLCARADTGMHRYGL